LEEKYNPQNIEKRWQQYLNEEKLFAVKDNPELPKFYCLEMFPYPSGKIHMGHVRNYTIGDVLARYKKLKGYQVLHPMGWDAFGLPAENAAIKAKTHPKEYTENSIKNFIKQQKALGLSYDWSRLITTSNPNYYRWKQWIFLQFYKKGLAYRKKSYVNFCPKCNTVLANEQVHDGKCWRCKAVVEQKELEQWFFKIREYADELLEGLKKVEWPEKVKIMQENWIGRSEGTTIKFEVKDSKEEIPIFTTRCDTIY